MPTGLSLVESPHLKMAAAWAAAIALIALGRSVASRDRTGFDALADGLLGHPASIDDGLEIVLGDRDRLQKDRFEFLAVRALPGFGALDLGELLAAGELKRDFRGALAELAGVLPDRDGLGAERDAVQRRLVGVLAGDRNGTGEPLRFQRGNGAAPSLEATTASTSLLLAVRICSMFCWALAGSQPSV